MTKFKVDSKIDDHADAPSPRTAAKAAAAPAKAEPAATGNNDMVANVATIGIVGVGCALIEVALIPGMVIGVAAALAPKYMPQLGRTFKPLFKNTLQGAHKISQKTREAFAETKERVNDLMAEVSAENKPVPAAVAAAEAEAIPAAH